MSDRDALDAFRDKVAGIEKQILLALVQANQNIFHQAAPKAADWASLYG